MWIWNWRNGQLKVTRSHGRKITDISCSFNGENCITSSHDGTIRVWNISIPKLLHKIDVIKKPVASVAFSPKEDRIFCGTSDGMIYIFETYNYEMVNKFKSNNVAITGIVFSPESNTFAISSSDGKLEIRDTNNLLLIKSIQAHYKNISQVIYNSRTKEYVSISPDRNTMFWDSKTGERKFCIRDELNCVNSISSSPDGTHLLQATLDGVIRIFNVDTKEYIYESFRNQESGIRCMALTNDKKYCLTAMDDCSIKKWDIETGKIVNEYNGHKKHVNSIQCARNSREFITACQDSKVRIIDIETGECKVELQGHTKSVNKAVFINGGAQCVSVSDDKTMRVWNIYGKKEVRIANALRSCTDVAANSEMFIVSALDNKLRGWEKENNWRLFTKHIHAQGPFAVVISPSKQHFASLHNSEIYVWDKSLDTPLYALNYHNEKISCIAYTADGMHIIGGFENGMVCVWELNNQTCARFSDKHCKAVTGIASLSEKEFVTSSEDGAIKVWDTQNFKCIKTINVPLLNLSGCDFSKADFDSDEIKNYIEKNGGII